MEPDTNTKKPFKLERWMVTVTLSLLCNVLVLGVWAHKHFRYVSDAELIAEEVVLQTTKTPEIISTTPQIIIQEREVPAPKKPKGPDQ